MTDPKNPHPKNPQNKPGPFRVRDNRHGLTHEKIDSAVAEAERRCMSTCTAQFVVDAHGDEVYSVHPGAGCDAPPKKLDPPPDVYPDFNPPYTASESHVVLLAQKHAAQMLTAIANELVALRSGVAAVARGTASLLERPDTAARRTVPPERVEALRQAADRVSDVASAEAALAAMNEQSRRREADVAALLALYDERGEIRGGDEADPRKREAIDRLRHPVLIAAGAPIAAATPPRNDTPTGDVVDSVRAVVCKLGVTIARARARVADAGSVDAALTAAEDELTRLFAAEREQREAAERRSEALFSSLVARRGEPKFFRLDPPGPFVGGTFDDFDAARGAARAVARLLRCGITVVECAGRVDARGEWEADPSNDQPIWRASVKSEDDALARDVAEAGIHAVPTTTLDAQRQSIETLKNTLSAERAARGRAEEALAVVERQLAEARDARRTWQTDALATIDEAVKTKPDETTVEAVRRVVRERDEAEVKLGEHLAELVTLVPGGLKEVRLREADVAALITAFDTAPHGVVAAAVNRLRHRPRTDGGPFENAPRRLTVGNALHVVDTLMRGVAVSGARLVGQILDSAIPRGPTRVEFAAGTCRQFGRAFLLLADHLDSVEAHRREEAEEKTRRDAVLAMPPARDPAAMTPEEFEAMLHPEKGGAPSP